MARSRIIFVNRVYRPSEAATAQLLTDLAEGLAARGWPVLVIAAGPGSGPLAGVTVQHTGPGVRHLGAFTRLFNYGSLLLGARRVLAKMTGPGDIVVLMTDPPLLAAAVTGLARRRGAKVVHWIQDIYPEIVTQHVGTWAGWLLRPLKWLRNRAWRVAELCLPVGDDMRTTIRQQGIPVARIQVLPNWAPRELHQAPDRAAIENYRRAHKLPEEFIVGYSGNLGRAHEFETLLAAARLEPGCNFRITGAGPRLPLVRATQTTQRLHNLRIGRPVPRDQLALSLAVCDAHLVTLRPGFESLVNPSKLAGILAAGRPVLFVGPPQSALAAFIQGAQIGAVIAPGDAAGLVATIRSWAERDGAVAAKLGRAARACYERHFTFDSALARWEALLHDLNLVRD